MSADESEARDPQKKRKIGILLFVLITISVIWLASRYGDFDKKRIGATAEVVEVASGLVYKARVDTGASVSSIHCEQIDVENESANPGENVGRKVRLLLKNKRGDSKWLETVIVDYSPIRSIEAAKHRYYVRLTLSCLGVRRESLVTLNDRSKMSHRLLLGRDFLKGNFLVDVSRDNPDLH